MRFLACRASALIDLPSLRVRLLWRSSLQAVLRIPHPFPQAKQALTVRAEFGDRYDATDSRAGSLGASGSAAVAASAAAARPVRSTGALH